MKQTPTAERASSFIYMQECKTSPFILIIVFVLTWIILDLAGANKILQYFRLPTFPPNTNPDRQHIIEHPKDMSKTIVYVYDVCAHYLWVTKFTHTLYIHRQPHNYTNDTSAGSCNTLSSQSQNNIIIWDDMKCDTWLNKPEMFCQKKAKNIKAYFKNVLKYNKNHSDNIHVFE